MGINVKLIHQEIYIYLEMQILLVQKTSSKGGLGMCKSSIRWKL